MAKYSYFPLPENRNIIRLLRLLPSKIDPENLRCELFEYTLLDSGTRHPYEALSYTWGGEGKPKNIIIMADHRESGDLGITYNLYMALLHLRDHEISRTIWVDAICINQQDEAEKGYQIRLMPAIYAKANRVVVWLGEAWDNSNQALEHIRTAAMRSTHPLESETTKQAIQQLIERPWFSRIWVLQEMAAARNIVIMCGSIEIDGHAFCLGLKPLQEYLKERVHQVSFLISGAIFRPNLTGYQQQQISLNICSLAELVDMYHLYNATKLHDKVYALIGMCSDDLSITGLEPNYTISWRQLFQNLVKFLLGNQVNVYTWDSHPVAVINATGYVLGSVVDIYSTDDTQIIFVTIYDSGRMKGTESFTLWRSGKSVQKEDIVCFFPGATKPSIVRLCRDYFEIIAFVVDISAHFKDPKNSQSFEWDGQKYLNWSGFKPSGSQVYNFRLIWGWDNPLEIFEDPKKYSFSVRTSHLRLENSERKSSGHLKGVDEEWNIALILRRTGYYISSPSRFRSVLESYKIVLGEEEVEERFLCSLGMKYGATAMFWVARNKNKAIVQMMLNGQVEAVVDMMTRSIPNVDAEDELSGRTILSYAAEEGQEVLMETLLMRKANVDLTCVRRRTALTYAAEFGKASVAKLLLENSADVNYHSLKSRTALSYAAENGYEAMVKLLLDNNANINLHYRRSPSPLCYAAKNGHTNMIKLLLDNKANVNSQDGYGETALSYAAQNGHEAVAQLLLEENADFNLHDYEHRTPLMFSVLNRHESIVKLLLERKAKVNVVDKNVRTPLSHAASMGCEVLVRLLLLEGKAKVDTQDKDGRTPLSYAASNGHGAVVKLLLEHNAEVNMRDHAERTPLSFAAQEGHEEIAKMLIVDGGAEIDIQDEHGKTPISYATVNGHEALVRLLQSFSGSSHTSI